MEKSSHKIIENYIYNTLYQIFNLMVPLITTPYISRVIGAEGIGEYSYVSSAVIYFNLFGTLGLAVYGQLETAKEHDSIRNRSRIFWGVLAARTAAMTAATAAYVCLYTVFPVPYKKMHRIQIIYLLAQIADVTWYFMGMDEFKIIAVRNFAVKITGTVLIFLCVKDAKDIYLYTVIVLAAGLFGNLSVLPSLRKHVVWEAPKIGDCLMHLKSSIIFFIPTIASSVYQLLDKIMIGIITGSSYQNGLYEQAHKMQLMTATVLTSLSVVMLPGITFLFKSEKHEELKRLINKSCEFTLCLGIPMAAGLFGISDTLIPLFLGDGFKECAGIVKILSPMIVFLGMDSLIGRECLMAGGRQKQYNAGVTGGACINLLLNLLLIREFGAYGAAIASAASEFVILLLFVFYSREFLAFRLVKKSGKYLGLSLVMLVCVRMIPYVSPGGMMTLAMQLITGVLVYFAGLCVTKDEIAGYISDTLRRRKG